MRKQEALGDTMRSLMKRLQNDDGLDRKKARESLVALDGID